MSDVLSESAIVSAVARVAAQRVTRRTIAMLQRMRDTLSGDDSELQTTWDEVCAQVQGQQSHSWDAYDDTVRHVVAGYVAKLPKYEREAIWLQTNAGIDWMFEEPEDRTMDPAIDDDTVDYLASEYVYAEADRWSNARIRAFIERSSMWD